MKRKGSKIQLTREAEEHYEVEHNTIFTIEEVITSKTQHPLYDEATRQAMYILKDFNYCIYDFEIR
jgi:L-rhamnose mutarotase